MNLDQALRAAAEPVPARVHGAPAQALLERIVTASAPAVPAPAKPRRRPRRTAIAVLTAVAAAVSAAAVTLLPNLGSDPAYASWTPQPSPLTTADRDELADRCTTRTSDEYHVSAPDRADRIVGAERRGDYAYVSVVTPAWTASCFRDRDGNLRDASIMMGPVDAAALGGTGVELQGWPQLRTQEGYCRLMTGHVGSQVVGVNITVRATSGGHSRTVQATVQDGYFLAWYPEQVDESSHNTTSLTLRLAGGGTVDGLSARQLLDEPRLN